jgi:hypothetical protein
MCCAACPEQLAQHSNNLPMSVGWQPNSSATMDSSSAWWLPVTSLGATEGPVPLLGAAAGLGACKAATVHQLHVCRQPGRPSLEDAGQQNNKREVTRHSTCGPHAAQDTKPRQVH